MDPVDLSYLEALRAAADIDALERAERRRGPRECPRRRACVPLTGG